MSASKSPLVMIPGPTELDASVLEALGEPSMAHADPRLIEHFGRSLELMRDVFQCKAGQPLILTASGTIGWDVIAANLVEPGQRALVVTNGYFGDRFRDCLEAYGVATTALTSQPGTAPTVDEITAALSAAGSSHFSLVTLTHVDTSSGVLTDIKACAAAIRAAQPNALIAVDGVCSIGGEELRMDEWGVDVAFTASQKAIGCPAGLALMVLGERAMAAFNDRVARKVPVTGWYASLANWLPIMKAYEARQPSYFATPAVNLIVALHKALDNLVGFPGGLSALFARQVLASDAFKAGIAAMGLTLVPKTHASAAHLLSAIRFPQGVGAGDLVPKVRARGAVITGGLLAPIKTEYFRVGHMGVSALQASRDDLLVTLRAIEGALIELGVAGVTAGAAEAAFNSVLRK